MSRQCASCKREVFPGPDYRMPPWCPSCGGDLKDRVEGASAVAVAETAEPSGLDGQDPESLRSSPPETPPAESFALPLQPPLRLDELGAPEQVFRGSMGRRLVCWVVCLVCFGLAAAIGYGVLHQPNKNPQSGLALMGLAAVGGVGCLYRALTLGELSYIVYRDALVQQNGNDSRIIPWDQIREVYQTLHPAWKKYELLTRGRSPIEITANIANYQTLGGLIEEQVVARRLPRVLAELEAGGTARFGPLEVSRGGMGFDGHSCGWSQISLNIGLNPEPVAGQTYSNLMHLHVHSPVRTRAYKVEISSIPNFCVFLEVVRRYGPQCLPPEL